MKAPLTYGRPLAVMIVGAADEEVLMVAQQYCKSQLDTSIRGPEHGVGGDHKDSLHKREWKVQNSC